MNATDSSQKQRASSNLQGARVLSGRELAARRRKALAARVSRLREAGITPGLATVLVGDDPASAVYVRNKIKACEATGIRSFHHHLPAQTSQGELLQRLESLNHDPQVHGILVQLPLPEGIDDNAVLQAIDPAKDSDGFHPFNLGRMFQQKRLDVETTTLPLPCTPAGCMLLIKESGVDISGKEAVVLGRSTIVGKPMAHLLLSADATVTICHSRTRNLPEVLRRADILVLAVGRARMVTGEMVKPGSVVIDVGINRTDNGLTGDADFASVSATAGYVTPVPGGVGPMTVQMLLENTVRACERAAGI